MLWQIGARSVDVSDTFAFDCQTYRMFVDNDSETFCIPNESIAESVQLLDAMRTTPSLDHLTTETLVSCIETADYLYNERACERLAKEIAGRLAGKSPSKMASILGVDFRPSASWEYELDTWLVPSARVEPWPSTEIQEPVVPTDETSDDLTSRASSSASQRPSRHTNSIQTQSIPMSPRL